MSLTWVAVAIVCYIWDMPTLGTMFLIYAIFFSDDD